MGCCAPKANKEDQIKQFWANLPIRQIHINKLANELEVNYKTDHIHRDVAAFRTFFLTPGYLLYGDEYQQEICTELFTHLAQEHEINLLIFCLCFLCQFDKNDEVNRRAISQISKFLNTHIIRSPDRTCDEEYMLLFHFKKFLKIYIEMLTSDSINPILSQYDDKDYIDHLKQIYSQNVVERLIDERVEILNKVVQIRLNVFLRNELNFLRDDHGIRTRLFILHDMPQSHRYEKKKSVEEERTSAVTVETTQYIELREEKAETVLFEERKEVVIEEPMIIYEKPEVKKATRKGRESWHDDEGGDVEKFAMML
jgi:hypothetical protein